MAKDPALLWYFNDWHTGTMTMSRHLKGCYMDLLCAQFNSGHLSLDEIKTVLGNDFAAWSQGALRKKFIQDDNSNFFNPRLEKEFLRRSSFTESRRTNAKQKHKQEHTQERMENRNENEIKDENGKDKHGLQIFVSELKNVSSLTEQLTSEECNKLTTAYGTEKVKDILLQMENKADLKKKYKSVYLTCNNWCKNNFNNNVQQLPKDRIGKDFSTSL